MTLRVRQFVGGASLQSTAYGPPRPLEMANVEKYPYYQLAATLLRRGVPLPPGPV